MFRIEMDALNAIYKEIKRTNELLEQLLEPKTTETQVSPIEHKPKRQYTRRVKEDVS